MYLSKGLIYQSAKILHQSILSNKEIEHLLHLLGYPKTALKVFFFMGSDEENVREQYY